MCCPVAAWLGMILGGLAGGLAGAVIRPMRTYRFSSISGAFCAALPGSAFGVTAGIIVSVFQMLLCNPDCKGGWYVPPWGENVQIVAILVGGVAGAFFAERPQRLSLRRGRLVLWTVVGALIGAFAVVPLGFDGYFVTHSNARPISFLAGGMLSGGFIFFLWSNVIETLRRSKSL